MYEHLSQRLDQVIKLAHEIAREYEQEYVGTEHLLLAIARDGQGLGTRVLSEQGASEDKIRDRGGQADQGQPGGHLGLRPPARHAALPQRHGQGHRGGPGPRQQGGLHRAPAARPAHGKGLRRLRGPPLPRLDAETVREQVKRMIGDGARPVPPIERPFVGSTFARRALTTLQIKGGVACLRSVLGAAPKSAVARPGSFGMGTRAVRPAGPPVVGEGLWGQVQR